MMLLGRPAVHTMLVGEGGTVFSRRVEAEDSRCDVMCLKENLNPAPFLLLRHAEQLGACAG